MQLRFLTRPRTCLPFALAALGFFGLMHSASAAAPASDHTLLLQLAARLDADDAKIAHLQAQLAARPTASSHPDASTTTYGPFTVTGKDVYLTGYNLHIQSGSGSTTGTVNGYGNLIIGYDETSSGTNTRTGSHNLVLGTQNNFASYGCIVAGLENNANGPDVAILGGRKNTASGHSAVIVGGESNTDSGNYSVIGGETSESNTATDAFLPEQTDISNLQTQVTSATSTNSSQATAISAIQNTLAPITTTSITTTGNDGNSHTGYLVTFSGANVQIVNGLGATNGEPNDPTDTTSAVTNGLGNLIIGYNSTRGSGSDTRTGSHNIIAGDQENYSSYGGIVAGLGNTTSAAYASVTGGGFNVAAGVRSSAVGGYGNDADGTNSLVGGGYDSVATGSDSTALGSALATSSGYASSVFGGYENTASYYYSAVTGGYENTASGEYSTVSGGSGETEANEYHWKGGTYESE